MTHRSFIAFFLALFVASCTYPFSISEALEPAKIAYVDSQRVVDESLAGQTALKELEKFKVRNEEELTQKAKEIGQLEEELRKKKFALSPEAQAEMEESIRRKNIELKRFKEDKEMEMKELYFKHLNTIKEQIVQIVQEVGEQKNYVLILNKDESILYGDPASDITKHIIELYDKKIQEESKK